LIRAIIYKFVGGVKSVNNLKGKIAWIFDDYFDVDLICGTAHIDTTDVEGLLKNAMQDFDPQFVNRVKPGEILVAGRALGYGHPHPQAMLVMRKLGIRTIIAKSFARVFFKNEVAAGMILLPCAALPADFAVGEELQIDFDTWAVIRCKNETVYKIDSIPKIEQEMIRYGGIVNFFREKKLKRAGL
jgi:3-isopropylmalate/(R)-2-methylmalate dehydratase small subunit